MKWFKSVFVQRFSAFELAVTTLLLTSDLSLTVLILMLVLVSVVDVVVERWLNLRNKNGNTPLNDL